MVSKPDLLYLVGVLHTCVWKGGTGENRRKVSFILSPRFKKSFKSLQVFGPAFGLFSLFFFFVFFEMLQALQSLWVFLASSFKRGWMTLTWFDFAEGKDCRRKLTWEELTISIISLPLACYIRDSREFPRGWEPRLSLLVELSYLPPDGRTPSLCIVWYISSYVYFLGFCFAI